MANNDAEELVLRECDPVCPTCHMRWAALERYIANTKRQRAAALAFVDRVRSIEESDAIRGIYAIAFAHGFQYQGPTWEAEEKALRDALATSRPKP